MKSIKTFLMCLLVINGFLNPVVIYAHAYQSVNTTGQAFKISTRDLRLRSSFEPEERIIVEENRKVHRTLPREKVTVNKEGTIRIVPKLHMIIH